MTRIQYAQRIGFVIVLGHIFVSLLVVAIAIDSDYREVLNLLKISVPVTVAYATTVLAWFGQMGQSSGRKSTRKIPKIESRLYSCVIYSFFGVLCAVPVVYYYVDDATIGFVELMFSGAELVFGACVGIIMRTLYGGGSAKS